MDYTQIILDINRKLEKLSKPEPIWVNAEMIKGLTGLNDEGMRRLRKDNPSLWKLKKTGGYLYNISAIPQAMIKSKV